MHKTVFAIGLLLLLPLTAAFAQGGGQGKAMSPVGLWDFEVELDSAPGEVKKSLVAFHFGGTATSTPATDPSLSLLGTWEKTGGRTFVVSFYSIFTDVDTGEHIGYVKVLVENVLVDKDTIEGRTEVWFLLGTDPFNPLAIFPVQASDDVGSRLSAEGPS